MVLAETDYVVCWVEFLCLRGLVLLGLRAFGLSVCAYLCPSVDQVKIVVQGRISRPINGSKLIFHMMVYLLETSMIIQEP